MKRPEAAVIFMIPRNSCLLWLSERIASNRPYFGFHATAGGSIEPGEKASVAAKRELEEETGLKVHSSRIQKLGYASEHYHPDGSAFMVYWFYVILNEDERPERTEPTKQGEWKTYPLYALPQPITPGSADAVRRLPYDVSRLLTFQTAMDFMVEHDVTVEPAHSQKRIEWQAMCSGIENVTCHARGPTPLLAVQVLSLHPSIRNSDPEV